MKLELYRGGCGRQKGAWRWRLRGSNGRILAVSGEGYTRRWDAIKGFQRLRIGMDVAGRVEMVGVPARGRLRASARRALCGILEHVRD